LKVGEYREERLDFLERVGQALLARVLFSKISGRKGQTSIKTIILEFSFISRA
jgi:hypothetical protein